jgi:hypothetical protein
MTNALSCCCLPHTFNPLSFYEAYLLSSIISVPHAVYLLQSNVFLSHETLWISYTETTLSLSWNLSPTVNRPSFSWNPLNLLYWNHSLSHETYLIQSTVFLSHKTHWIFHDETSLSLMKPISYSQSSFFLMKPSESLLVKPLSQESYLLQSTVFLFHVTHRISFAETSISRNLSPAVNPLFSYNYQCSIHPILTLSHEAYLPHSIFLYLMLFISYCTYPEPDPLCSSDCLPPSLFPRLFISYTYISVY